MFDLVRFCVRSCEVFVFVLARVVMFVLVRSLCSFL